MIFVSFTKAIWKACYTVITCFDNCHILAQN